MNTSRPSIVQYRTPTGVRGEPQEHGEERGVDEDEGTACRFVHHVAQDEKEPPLALVDGVEFVGDEAREGEKRKAAAPTTDHSSLRSAA